MHMNYFRFPKTHPGQVSAVFAVKLVQRQLVVVLWKRKWPWKLSFPTLWLNGVLKVR